MLASRLFIYKLRDGANRKHDIIFLASYIHDAILFKVHRGHVVTSNSLLVAIGIDPSGRREVLGFDSRLIKKSGVVTV